MFANTVFITPGRIILRPENLGLQFANFLSEFLALQVKASYYSRVLSPSFIFT